MTTSVIPTKDAPRIPAAPYDFTDPVDRYLYGTAVAYVKRGDYLAHDLAYVVWGNRDLLTVASPGHPAGVPPVDESRLFAGEYDSASGTIASGDPDYSLSLGW